uniref:Rab-GAP TBC domain-containing protein n=1 Tax=Macrostomum lignano TaxID=282301 RepID=A0A1I8I2Z3_9PLAT
MACDVATAPGNPVFSPLTLFECTVTNAQMLVESMADRELLRALKIANSLHTHIVGIMEPRYDRVCQRSDEHEACPRSVKLNNRRRLSPQLPSTSSSSLAAAQFDQLMQPAVKLARLKCDNGDDQSMPAVAKVEASSVSDPPTTEDADAADNDAAADYGFDAPASVDNNFLDDDDCLLIGEDSTSEGILGMSTSSSTAAGAGLSRRRQRRLPRRSSTAAAAATTATMGDEDQLPDSGVSGAGSSAHQPDVGALCKSAIHLAYKEMKGGGPHLFDFSMPFSDPVNFATAEQVIARAMQLQPGLEVSTDFWWSQLCPVELNRLARSEKLWRQRLLMRRLRSKDSKLTRRQKSFELIAGRLSTEDFDKFRVILSRDYTSSDEEFEDCSASAAATASAGAPLRVRELPWESAEMAEMKRQLDTAYLDSCATAKQSEQLRRVARGTGCLSVRPPPADCPDWAIRRETADPGDLGNADC